MIKHNLMFDCPQLEIDVDKLLDQIKGHNHTTVQTVRQSTVLNDYEVRPVRHPSWDGKLETKIETSPNDQTGLFRCGR